MGIILFVCPDKSLETQVRKTVAETDNQVEVITSSQFTFAEDLKKIDKEISIIVSRGRLGKFIADNFDYHVIFLHVSLADVMIQVNELKQLGSKKIAVLGTKSWIETDPSKLTEDAFGCQFIIVQDSETRIQTLKELPRMGFDAVITYEGDLEAARSYGLQCMSLMTSSDSILAGYNEAKFVANVIHKEELRTRQLNTLLDTAVDAYVMMNSNEVTYANNMTYKLFQKDKITNEDINPFVLMHNVPSRIKDSMVLVNATTYLLPDDEYGYIISFKDVSNIQKSEQIIRRSFKQGFTAKYNFDNIIRESIAMKQCVSIAKEYAKFDSNILITGETGTGKELFAQSIHNASHRRNEPFVSINCASIHPNMLESELFGFADSSSSGVRKQGKYGLFELAHGGTLFLDEIGSLPMNLQSRLLRVLQEKELLRIGDDKVIPVDVRIICSTNKNLLQAIKRKEFRSDLYYRINILNLDVPSLRSRKADIGSLFKFFIHVYATKYGNTITIRDNKCFEMLEKYDWPGNVRELMNLAERSVILCKSGIISESFLADLMNSELSEYYDRKTSVNVKRQRKPDIEEIERLLQSYSRQDICRMFGISRTTLWRILKEN